MYDVSSNLFEEVAVHRCWKNNCSEDKQNAFLYIYLFSNTHNVVFEKEQKDYQKIETI